jgi:hypothetical protein
MNIDTIRERIEAKLYGEEFTRGVLEFDWGRDSDPSLFNDKLKAAKEECLKVDVRWVDADPMSARTVVIAPKEHAKAVVDIMAKYGFSLVNSIFDPKASDKLHGTDMP